MSVPGTMVDVKNYFGYTSAAAFSGDWKRLDDAAKDALKAGVGKGVSKDGTPPAGATLDY